MPLNVDGRRVLGVKQGMGDSALSTITHVGTHAPSLTLKSPPISYYQNIAGKGEPIRLALNHAGIPFTDVGHSSTVPPLVPIALAITAPLPLYGARTLHLSRLHPRACSQCAISHAPELSGPAIVCSLARSSHPLAMHTTTPSTAPLREPR